MEKHIKDILKNYIDTEPIGDVYYEQKLRTFLKNEINQSISSRIAEIQFRKGELTLRIPSASLRHDLFLNRDKLKSKFNNHLKGTIVKQILFR